MKKFSIALLITSLSLMSVFAFADFIPTDDLDSAEESAITEVTPGSDDTNCDEVGPVYPGYPSQPRYPGRPPGRPYPGYPGYPGRPYPGYPGRPGYPVYPGQPGYAPRVVCYAKNARGMTFDAVGYSEIQVQQWAVQECYNNGSRYCTPAGCHAI